MSWSDTSRANSHTPIVCVCKRCKQDYTSRGRHNKWCPACRKAIDRERKPDRRKTEGKRRGYQLCVHCCWRKPNAEFNKYANGRYKTKCKRCETERPQAG